MTLTPLQEAWLHHKRGEPYTLPEVTVEERCKKYESELWTAQQEVRRVKRILDHLNSKHEREMASKELWGWERLLLKAKRQLEKL
jgi:hypothetical protein